MMPAAGDDEIANLVADIVTGMRRLGQCNEKPEDEFVNLIKVGIQTNMLIFRIHK